MIGTTGREVGEAILETLQDHDIFINMMVGMCFDGGANYSGKISGAQAFLKTLAEMAEYFHCLVHKLNLAANDSIVISHIVYFIEDVQAVKL